MIKVRGGRYKFFDSETLVVGELHYKLNRDFYIKDKKFGNVYIKDADKVGAISGDILKAELILKKNTKSYKAKVIEIIKRNNKFLYGMVLLKKGKYFFNPIKKISRKEIFITNTISKNFSSELIYKAKIIDYGDLSKSMLVEIVKDVKDLSNPKTDYRFIVDKHKVRTDFSINCKKEAENLKKFTDFNDFKGRKDFRNLKTITIDPDSAKDFDDALSLEISGNDKYTVYIHIADVSHFVKPGSYIDTEAKLRGTSIYLADRNIPMLPEILTSDLCSLLPNKNRYTLTAIITLDNNLEVKNLSITKGVINSNLRLTYKEAQGILDSGEGEYHELLFSLNQIANRIRSKRFKKNSFNIYFPEPEFFFSNDDVPSNIHTKIIYETHSLIEEFMLLTNKTIAENISNPKNHMIFRNHPKPKHEIWNEIKQILSHRNINPKMEFSDNANAIIIQNLIDDIKDPQISLLVENMLLKSLPKAIYSTENSGHFGLGFDYYCHFTSPIRRYPDIIVHRFLKGIEDKDAAKIALSATESEIKAVKIEREYNKIKQLRYLNKQSKAQTYNGTISGVINFGLFITLDNICIDGFVRIGWIDDDDYYFNENINSIIGRNYKSTYSVGKKVVVKVKNIILSRQKLDLLLIV